MARSYLSVLLLFVASVTIANAWYTCKDLPFCDRIRSNEGQPWRFYLDKDSVNVYLGYVVIDVKHIDTNQTLKFVLTALADETFRMQINDPLKPRHTMEDALDGPPTTVQMKLVKFNENNIVITTYGAASVLVNFSPFFVTFSYNDKIVAMAATKGYMAFNSEENDQAIAMDFYFAEAQKAYGLPEHAERLTLINTELGSEDPYRMFNLDYGYYKTDSREALYGSVPVIYGHGVNLTTGVFWLNSAQTFVDVGYSGKFIDAMFISESGALDVFVLTGPTLQETVRQYAKLTGTAPLPNYFALGYHQSRYSYMTQDDLETVVSEFDAHDFPLDVIWLDIDYTDNKKYFTWDKTAFPDPLGMQKKLNSTGRKLVVIIDPHIKVEEGYHVYDQGREGNYFVKNADGIADFQGDCWPGLSSYIDFTNPKASEWYSKLYESFTDTSNIVHIWNDMNEPSVFNEDEQTMPGDLTHYDGWKHRDLHNVYGFYQTRATYEGLMRRDNGNQRPFILTRAHFAGSQRYTAIWTGDNIANWPHLRFSIPMCLTEALAGISFCGADVGGFIDNVEDELFQRWYQVGAWLPFFRAHSTNNVDRREPYLYPADIQHRFRTAMQQRYAHLPYWYTLWHEHSRTGDPVIRPLVYHYPDDVQTHEDDWQWLVGRDILVSPVLDQGVTERISYFPKDDWFDIDNNLYYPGPGYSGYPVNLDSVPVFYRGGSIVPRKDQPRPSTVHTVNDPYSIYVFTDKAGKASGRLYLDDLESFEYKNKKYLYVEFTYEDHKLNWEKVDEDADYWGESLFSRIIVYRPPDQMTGARMVTGEEVTVKYGGGEDGMFYMDVTGLRGDLRKPGSILFY